MSNLIDLLLAAEDKKFKMPSKEVEIKRLSEILGVPFKVKCEAISVNAYEEIQEQTMKVVDGQADVNINDLQVFTIMEGVFDDSDKKLFLDKDVQKRFGCHSPKDLVKKLLLSGEISKLYNVISDLSGFGKDAVEEIKN